MIEELTPQIVVISVFIVLTTAPLVTLAISMLLLWGYQRAVLRAMATSGGFETSTAEIEPETTLRQNACKPGKLSCNDLYQYAVRAAWRNAARCLFSGLAFALVFATAAHFVFPYQLGLPGFITGVWIYFWPAVLSLLLIIPGRWQFRAVWGGVYFIVLVVLGLWMSTVLNLPDFRFGGLVLPARSTVTPFTLGRLWLVVNAAPTLLILLCFNRWVRAVAPLVLALAAAAISGTWIAILALFSPRGIAIGARIADSLSVHAGAVVLGTIVLALLFFVVLGWVLVSWIALAYRSKKLSDQSLLLDAVWLLFASGYAMWLVLGGLLWVATAPAAFVAYKIVMSMSSVPAVVDVNPAPGLTFLRVFSLGRRSERLINEVARYWRYIGSVQMITGPDLARSTVQPHQFLDFLSGKLARHFVRDRASIERAIADQDRAPDPDGRFRINNIFCHADSWQEALRVLTRDNDRVLMDLRRFSETNTGCRYELQYLVENIPFGRCVFIVDGTTDTQYLERTIKDYLDRLLFDSPNYGCRVSDAPIHRLDSQISGRQNLIRRLCAV